MKRPPTLMHLRIQKEERGFGLWLPLFLLLLLALVVFIILSPLILIAILVLWPSGRGKTIVLIVRAAFQTLWSMRGLKVDFQSGPRCMYITVI